MWTDAQSIIGNFIDRMKAGDFTLKGSLNKDLISKHLREEQNKMWEKINRLPDKDFEYTVKFEENLTAHEREKKCFMLGYLKGKEEVSEIIKGEK